MRSRSAQTWGSTPARAWPDALIAQLENYLAVWRPLLAGRRRASPIAAGERLWISAEGRPLSAKRINHTLKLGTEVAFDRRVNPHLFRDAWATTMAIDDPAHIGVMTAVLGHANPNTMERHYQQASSLQAQRAYAAERGWTVVDVYSDAAISGASRFRPGFQKLLTDAGHRQFEAVICGAVDRLGRRLADTADLQVRLAFHSVKLFTPTLGEITQFYVAVMGMMAQMALKDFGEKTRRGQLGRVLKGKSAGGRAYGYRIPSEGAQAAVAITTLEALSVNQATRTNGSLISTRLRPNFLAA